MPSAVSRTPAHHAANARVDVFFYSYYQDTALLRARGADPRNPRPACLRGWRLSLRRYSNLLNAPGHSAWGTLFALTHAEIDALYRYPGVPEYLPRPVLVHTQWGPPTPALCYLLRDANDDGEPQAEHVANLRQVMLRRGLPVDALNAALGTQPPVADADRDAPDLPHQLAWLNTLCIRRGEAVQHVCQCETIRLAERSRDTDRFVAVFCAYAFLDQFVYAHFRHAHADFKRTFAGPALRAHGSRGYAHPSWLLDERGHGTGALDLARLRALFEGLVGEGIGWLAREPGVPLEDCATTLRRELGDGELQAAMAPDVDVILHRARKDAP